MSELVITESTFNLIKSVGEPNTCGSFNIIFVIIISLIIMTTLSIFSYYKKIQREKNRQNLSYSKELVVYNQKHNKDKKDKENKQNIYNKYYFNVYVKQPYNKNGKQNNYNNKANYKYQKENTDDIIDAENINNSYSEQAGQKLALGDEITGHGGARGVLKEGFSKYIGNSEDAEIAKDAFFNNLTQNQNAILSQSGSNKTAGELATSLKAYAKGEVSLGIGVPGGTGAKASLGVEAAIGASLRQVGENATSADFNRIMNEQIFNNVSQQVAFGKIKAEDFDKALEQAYDAYNNVLKDIAKGTGSMNPYTETDGMFDMPTNPSKK